jgi:hypothetical protein
MTRVTDPFVIFWLAVAIGAIAAKAGPTIERCDDNTGMTFVGWSEWTQVTQKTGRFGGAQQ